MSRRKRILIIGAGAVGRGFVAPLISNDATSIDFMDNNDLVVNSLSTRDRYITAFCTGDTYQLITVHYNQILRPENITNVSEYDAVFISVGVSNYLDYASLLQHAREVVVLENTRASDSNLRNNSSNNRIYFGIPDVITSNTAPSKLLHIDPLCLVSERGELVLPNTVSHCGDDNNVCLLDSTEFEYRWACKFFIHNTCHAIVAFLGAIKNYTYIADAMRDARISIAVENAMAVLRDAISVQGLVPRNTATEYMDRELHRFRNPLLHDPISRVARDPLRKLAPDDRLVQALHVVKAAALDVRAIVLGINAALHCWERKLSIDVRSLREPNLLREQVLRETCGMHDDTLIDMILNTSAVSYLSES